jgi:hypothetical protein
MVNVLGELSPGKTKGRPFSGRRWTNDSMPVSPNTSPPAPAHADVQRGEQSGPLRPLLSEASADVFEDLSQICFGDL